MREMIVVWILLATIVGWGSYVFAKRDRRSTSWTKIAFAAVPLAIFGLIAICLFLLPSETLVPRGTTRGAFRTRTAYLLWGDGCYRHAFVYRLHHGHSAWDVPTATLTISACRTDPKSKFLIGTTARKSDDL
jgi:hypothetical protein